MHDRLSPASSRPYYRACFTREPSGPRAASVVARSACLLVLWAAGASAQGSDQATDNSPSLASVVVRSTRADLQGIADSASEGEVTRKQLQTRPLVRAGDVLESVPGLVASQHSGEGKANQYFVRGINLDHGTDFATFVDGVPINLPTHGHGQGYTDLNFLIPELVDSVGYRKGPYYAQEGDFSAAGSARIRLLRKLDAPLGKIELGGNGFRRALAAGSHTLGDGDLLYALETARDDGPWTVPQRLRKSNGLLKWTQGTPDNGMSLGFSAYTSRWTSTDQVPQAALDRGLIGRYGSLDPTDGGSTSRYALNGQWAQSDGNTRTEWHGFVARYRFQLFSNFSYATRGCDDSTATLPAACGSATNLDQFEQQDQRTTFGLGTSRRWRTSVGGHDVVLQTGADYRYDRIGRVALYDSYQRARLNTTRSDQVGLHALGLWTQADVDWSERLRSQFGLRLDTRRAEVQSLLAANSGKAGASIASPKINLSYAATPVLDLHANWGHGYHSNDARGALTRVDPRNPARQVDPADLLVRAKGYEIGTRWKALPTLSITAAAWLLDIDSELLFVGDAGATEPSRPSHRRGLELTANWRPARQWEFDADVSLSRSRFRGSDPASNYIPGAMDRVASIGSTWQDGPWTAGLRLRYFGSRALVEDNALRGSGSTLVNARAGWRASRNLTLQADMFNLFNRRANDIEYAYASRLPGEPAFVDGKTADRLHLHPSAPRTLRISATLQF